MRLWCHIGAICISIFGVFRGIIYLNCGFLTAPNWWIFGSIFFIICNVVLFIGLVMNRTDCIKIWLIFQGIIESVSTKKSIKTNSVQWFHIAKTRHKINSLDVISRVFPNKLLQIYVYFRFWRMSFTLKNCQTVAGISMYGSSISRFFLIYFLAGF